MDTAGQTVIETSTGFLPFFLTLLLAAVLAVVVWAFATFIGPRRPSREKMRTYECGIRPKEPVHRRLDIQFYRLGILFMILGVELVFFFPWALALANGIDRAARIVALADMVVFAAILVAAFVFAWAKGGFRWFKPYGGAD
jgi:NADH-quinone oxidoreductase subunit A